MSEPTGWDGIPDANETILWQGRPGGTCSLRPERLSLFIFGLFLAGFALTWMILAAGAGGMMRSFGLIHFSVGVGLATGFDRIERARDVYEVRRGIQRGDKGTILS